MIPKCRKCENTEFQDMNGSPNRWYCKHPEVREHVSCPADTLICKTERYSTEITIKTSPKLRQVLSGVRGGKIDDRRNRCNGCWCADLSLRRDRLGIKCRKQG